MDILAGRHNQFYRSFSPALVGRRSIAKKLGVEGRKLSWKDTWQWLSDIVEGPHGILEKKIFLEGDKLYFLRAKEALRRKKQMEKEAAARRVMEATKALEDR